MLVAPSTTWKFVMTYSVLLYVMMNPEPSPSSSSDTCPNPAFTLCEMNPSTVTTLSLASAYIWMAFMDCAPAEDDELPGAPLAPTVSVTTEVAVEVEVTVFAAALEG